MEVFKKIDWLGDCYYVSNQGRVKSFKQNKNGKILHPRTDSKGYKQVYLSYNGSGKNFMVHRLVAECFLGKPSSPDMQVNHKDGVKSNNHLENLEWCTQSENMLHSIHVLGKKPPALGKFGSEAPYHRAIYQYDNDFNLIKKWDSLIEASRFYNDKTSAIWKCANGLSKHSKGFIWRYDLIKK